MSDENQNATSEQHAAITTALARIIPPNLTQVEAGYLLERIGKVVSAATPIALSVAHRSPSRAVVNVIAEFKLDGVKHDAVRLSTYGDSVLVPYAEVIHRAEDGGDGAHVVRSDDEWQRVFKYRHELPRTLCGYSLITARLCEGELCYYSGLEYVRPHKFSFLEYCFPNIRTIFIDSDRYCSAQYDLVLRCLER